MSDFFEDFDRPEQRLFAERLQARFFATAEALFLVGSTPWEVDEAVQTLGLAQGPFERQDHLGLDNVDRQRRVWIAAKRSVSRDLPLLGRMLELGKLGRKTGAGWYRYPGGGGKVEDPIVADLALEEAHFGQLERTDYSQRVIARRMNFAISNEVFWCLDSSHHVSEKDMDLALSAGVGWPVRCLDIAKDWDTIGLPNVANSLEILSTEDAQSWAACAPLLQCLSNGLKMQDWLHARR